MQTTRDDMTFVETPTDYDTHNLETEDVIELHIGGIERQAVTTIAQQLSLFVETHETRVLLRLLDALEIGIDDDDAVAVDVGTPAAAPDDCYWPVEVEIEGVESSELQAIVEAFDELAAEGFADSECVEAFRDAVVEATSGQPRSIVRLVKGGGSRGDALEWHTDTSADLGSE